MASPLHVIGELKAHAIGYAADGLEVFPVDPGSKRPMATVVHGAPSQYSASADVELVASWWDRWPNALIGHRLAADTIVLDIDPRHGGDGTWQALREHFGLAPTSTRIHMSGRGDGGGHLWFQRPEGKLTISQLDDWAEQHGTGHAVLDKAGAPTGHWVCGLDLLHRDHRYTILPPSPHPETGQPYRWHQWTDVAPLPSEVVALLVDQRPPPPAFVPKAYEGDSIVDWYTAKHSLSELLHRHGWTLRRGSGDGDGSAWQHPNATSPVSATVRHGCLFVYSPNTPFPVTAPGDPNGITVFTAFAVLEHGGDQSAAARAARELKDGPRPARLPDFRGLPERVIDPSTGEITTPVAAEATTVADDGADDGPPDWILPIEFWESRPSLAHIRQAAHSRIRSADLVLHGVLARLSAYTPHTYELPALAGSVGSLNYFTIAVGPSGAGKSSGSAIADDLLARPRGVEDKPLGSGEGLAENYMGTVTEEDEGGKKKAVRRQVLHNVFVYGDEGAALTEMMQRKGATLPEALRRAWTGGALGQSNATTERTRVIPAGNYRLGVLIGFQPEVAAQLMADAIAGTPQRFTWAWAGDPNVPDAHDIPPWPGELEVPAVPSADVAAHTLTRGGYRRIQLGVHDDIRREVVADAVRRARGEAVASQLDSHQPLHLLKIAGLLALLEGRLDIDPDDWALAKTVWETSRRVRRVVEGAVADEQHRQEVARIDFHARRESAAEAARSGTQGRVLRIGLSVARWVHDNPVDDGYSRAQLGRRVAGRDRHLLDSVIDQALSRDWLVETELGTYRGGAEWPRVSAP